MKDSKRKMKIVAVIIVIVVAIAIFTFFYVGKSDKKQQDIVPSTENNKVTETQQQYPKDPVDDNPKNSNPTQEK